MGTIDLCYWTFQIQKITLAIVFHSFMDFAELFNIFETSNVIRNYCCSEPADVSTVHLVYIFLSAWSADCSWAGQSNN